MSTNQTYHIESETEIVDKNNMNTSKINEHLGKSTHLLYPENYRMNVLAINFMQRQQVMSYIWDIFMLKKK
jgi:hypothetical protein